MARTKEFDTEVALERAMQTFWARGYEATSAQDLVDALGINRSSLYATFGSKAQLYRRALARYGESSTMTVILGAGPLKPRLRDGLRTLMDESMDPDGGRGCFACNAAVERGPVDADVRALVRQGFGTTRDVLLAELDAAAERGELAPGADTARLADWLLVTIEGLHVIAKGTRDRRLVRSVIDSAVGAL